MADHLPGTRCNPSSPLSSLIIEIQCFPIDRQLCRAEWRSEPRQLTLGNCEAHTTKVGEEKERQDSVSTNNSRTPAQEETNLWQGRKPSSHWGVLRYGMLLLEASSLCS